MKLLLILLCGLASAAPGLVKVRVFYGPGGRFLAKYMYAGGPAQPRGPRWATGHCDIAAANWNESSAHGRKIVDPATCTFLEAAPNAREVKVERVRVLKLRLRAGTITAAEKDELLQELVELLLLTEG